MLAVSVLGERMWLLPSFLFALAVILQVTKKNQETKQTEKPNPSGFFFLTAKTPPISVRTLEDMEKYK